MADDKKLLHVSKSSSVKYCFLQKGAKKLITSLPPYRKQLIFMIKPDSCKVELKYLVQCFLFNL